MPMGHRTFHETTQDNTGPENCVMYGELRHDATRQKSSLVARDLIMIDISKKEAWFFVVSCPTPR